VDNPPCEDLACNGPPAILSVVSSIAVSFDHKVATCTKEAVGQCLNKVSPCGYVRRNDFRRYNPARGVIDAPRVDLKG